MSIRVILHTLRYCQYQSNNEILWLYNLYFDRNNDYIIQFNLKTKPSFVSKPLKRNLKWIDNITPEMGLMSNGNIQKSSICQ